MQPGLDRQYLTVNFRSSDSSVPTQVLLQELNDALPEIRKDFEATGTVKDISVSRDGTLPGFVETAVLTFTIMIGTEVTKEIAKKIADDIYEWIKRRFKNAHVEKAK